MTCSTKTRLNPQEAEIQDRQNMVLNSIILRRQEDSGLKPVEDKILAARSASIERHLTNLGISPSQYEQVYELAVQIYNETDLKGPFGIDFLIQAGKRIKEAINYNARFKKPTGQVRLLSSAPSCKLCNGTKLMYKYDTAGNPIGVLYEEVDGKRKAMPCKECVINESKD